ncbi:MAG: T9SS type A sorting domain-containing protein [Bacteroidia bacterium]|nr:T9SS type A sorting domain-containing protein [Bacteroidia bacterium]
MRYFILTIVLILVFGSFSKAQNVYPKLIGINVSDDDRNLFFIDVVKSSGSWEELDGNGNTIGDAPIDSSGWPTTDFQMNLWDMRPLFAWVPPMDDPDSFQIDLGGTYKLSYMGQADIYGWENWAESNKVYDSGTNTTTSDITITSGAGQFVINFTNTNNGIQNIKLTRPDFDHNTSQRYNDPFIDRVKPFHLARFKDFTGTDGNCHWDYGTTNTVLNAPQPIFQDWDDRPTVDDIRYNVGALSKNGIVQQGFPWEDLIEVAKLMAVDPWICVPINATDNYVRELAKMLKSDLMDLDTSRNIYVELSNEVWNGSPGFEQTYWNVDMARVEADTNNIIAADGETDTTMLGERRFVRRTIEISVLFQEAFGASLINDRIRIVLATQFGWVDRNLRMMNWAKKNVDAIAGGVLSDHLYAWSGAPYYSSGSVEWTGSPEEIVAGYDAYRSNDNTTKTTLITMANDENLKYVAYEVGPGTTGIGDANNVGDRVRAERLEGMYGIVQNAFTEDWFDLGGDEYMYFTLIGAYGRYGQWGSLEDITDDQAPKYRALIDLIDTNYNSVVTLNPEDTEELTIYPNPSNSIINIKETGFLINKIEFYTTNGKLIPKEMLQYTNSSIDISNLKNGVYFMKISGDTKLKINKIIKLR